MHPSASTIVNTPCKQPSRVSALVRILTGAPAFAYALPLQTGKRHLATPPDHRQRALPSAGRAHIQGAASRSPSTPLPEIRAKAPMRYGSFRGFCSPRGGVPQVLAEFEKEKSRGKIESSRLAQGVSHE